MELRPGKSAPERFLDERGRVTRWPAKRKDQLVVLGYLASKFEGGVCFTEAEVNALLAAWHTFGDPALLRRDLCDAGLLARERDGSAYRRREQ